MEGYKAPARRGAEANLIEQAAYWVKWGNQVTLLTARFSGSEKMDNIKGVNIIRIGSKYTIYSLFPFYYLFKLRKNYDFVIDIENGIPFFTPLYCRKPKVCIMHHVHTGVFSKELPFFIAWVPWLLESKLMPPIYRDTKFIAVSESTKKEMLKLGIKEKNISIVPNGIDHKIYKPGTKAKHPLIVYVGRLKAYKRLNLLIESFNEVLKEIKNAKLIIAGRGDDEPNLRKQVSDLRLENKVEFLGFIPEKEKVKLLQSAWCFVTPSSKEGWGVSVIEANACGTPCIAFDTEGLRDSIVKDKTGYLVSTQNEMTEKIIKILENKVVRERLSKSALKWSKNFDWEKSALSTLKIMEDN